jgi:hypothetical protein
LQAGSLFGTGTVDGKIASGGTVTPGDSSTLTGVLTDSGAYTQATGGKLDIYIGGTTVGTKYDQLKTTTSSLNGTLNISLISGFVPTIGSTFKIVTFSSETGHFATVNGLPINSSEHFTITYQGTDVLLTVASGALNPSTSSSALALPKSGLGLSKLNLHADAAAGFVTSTPASTATQFGFSAPSSISPSSSFQAAAASVLASSTPHPAPLFAAMGDSIAAQAGPTGLRLPSRIANSSSATHANNGAYGLRNRAVGGGFAFPLSHLSKPQLGFTVE